ncbi:MAG: MFS transporter [Clostridia bacterium]|nr:MFS transporter [Clostridia bacterium]
MAFSYSPSNTSSKQKMNMSSWSMQVTSSINNIISLFASTFLVSYIVQVNADAPLGTSLVSVALYYIALYCVMAVTYFLMGYLVDKSSRIWYYRIGILIKGAFIVFLIFLGEELAKLSFLAGALYGIAESFYWSSYNVMKCEIIPRAHADKFVAINTLLNKFINVVFPVLIGFMIDVSTFAVVAIYVLVIVAIQLVFSFFIKSQRPENSNFQFFKYVKKLRGKTDDIKRIKRFYPIALCYGATTICTSLVSILSIYTFKTNLNLGLFTAGFSVLSVIALLLFKKFTKVGGRRVLYVIMSIVPVMAGVMVACKITQWTYIVFNIAETVSLTLLAYALDVQRTIILKKTGHYEDIAEHQTLTELCFCGARILTFVLMLVFGLLLDVNGLRVLTLIISFAFPLLCIFLAKMEKVEKDFPIETRVVAVEAEPVCENVQENKQ